MGKNGFYSVTFGVRSLTAPIGRLAFPGDRYPFCHLTLRGKKPTIASPKCKGQVVHEVELKYLVPLITQRRVEREQTVREASLELGIPPGRFRRWISGIHAPQIRSYSRIIAYLGYDPWAGREFSFGDQLRLARLRAGLARDKLAKRLGMDYDAYRRWEDEQLTFPGVKERRLLEKFLKEGVPPEEESGETSDSQKTQT